LSAAIEWQSERIEQSSGIQCRLDLEELGTHLDEDLSTTIYRIFKEAILNAARHSAATKINVNLNTENGVLILIIADDGVGITEEQKDDPTSLGLISMIERAYIHEGTVDIWGNETEGTTVEVRIPMTKQDLAGD
jgi:signal transduction histidine kinase